ncbi:organic cation transporter protein-like [Bombyx mandarina]|uniref:Organic cation transporter protein-like n=1 Tax=Bombyx mandarina TaxID=7092 RepID=A0A6J2KTL6_BOMMA|nr:organic cation transporter protein-like [Bombyx mandarina]
MASEVKEEWCSGWGRWQVRLALLLALPVFLTGAYGTNYVFLAGPTEYRCRVPECEGSSSKVSVTAETWSQPWTKWALVPNDPCRRWSPKHLDGACTADAFDNSTSEVCENFVYRASSSIVVEFDLACKEWMRSLVGTIHCVGMLISLPIIGFISDRWGRRSALIVSSCGAGVFGLCKSFVGSYYMYVTAEMLETAFGASVYPSAFVLMIEWLGVEHRVLASFVLGIPLSLGAAFLSLLDYLTGHWRLWARIAYPPSFLFLLYPWVLPESVRWLITRGRVSEAVATIRSALNCNRMTIPKAGLEKTVMNEQEAIGSSGVLQDESLLRALIKYEVLRRRLFVCCVWWLSCVFVFYGLAVRAHVLAGSAHVNYALVAGAELPALALNTLLLDRVGRRPLLTAALLLTAVSLITLPCLPQSSTGWGTALYLSGKVGVTMSLNALYVYTAELFPTRARHRLLAACSAVGRVGAIFAPLTSLLAEYRAWLPTVLFGSLPLLSAALTFLVPDTLHQTLPDSFADLEESPPPVHINEA